MNRRDFLRFTGLASGSMSIPAIFTSCAFDPVTGQAMFSLVSEEQEISLDLQQSPHQFSADYGATSDSVLNNYVSQIGRAVAKNSHRAHMPYNYRVLDANHVNAYTFPGGSMAVTRGIIVEMQSESELAALLGHEIGHVNAHHSSERVTKGMLAQAVVGLASSAVNNQDVQKIITGVGTLSATALLAKYSRDNEREADRLGMSYAVAAGANPKGMVDLMNLLNGLHASSPGALEIMFSSHPMSTERLVNSNKQMSADYSVVKNRNMGRDRYMDYTKSLRGQKKLIKFLAQADLAITADKFSDAQSFLSKGKKVTDEDYAMWIISAKVNMAISKSMLAIQDLNRAQALKPSESLPIYMRGVNYLDLNQPENALVEFKRYDQRLPGNPMAEFFTGFSYEQLAQHGPASESYKLFLQQVTQGAQAEHAYRKLLEWGYIS